jgi:CIC family chloride channel protein
MNTEETKKVPRGVLFLSLVAIPVGIGAGLGAVIFRGLIGLFHNFLFFGKLSFFYDANVHTPPSHWGALVILIPVAGAWGVAFLVKNFAPEAKGSGMPEVIDSIYYHKAAIRPVVAWTKAGAAALSIGSGASVGREGPIAQIGSAVGSAAGRLFELPLWQRVTLIAAGTGGGIAATFNTPIGGILFAVELMLHELSAKTLVPLAVATAVATYIGRLFFGDRLSFVLPAFQAPHFTRDDPFALLYFVALGLIIGGASALFIKAVYGFEDFFNQKIKGSYYRRHMLGMFVVGVLLYVFQRTTGHYYIEGVGYATIQDMVSGGFPGMGILVALFACKLFVTAVALGSGASGGIFSPAMFLGAAVGGAYGIILHHLLPGLLPSPASFVVAGMAGVAGASTGAALAAVVMIFEMTFNSTIIVPMIITVAISYAVRKMLSKESIYTLKIARKGHQISDMMQRGLPFFQPAKDVMETPVVTFPASATLASFARESFIAAGVSYFVVEEGGKVVGVSAIEKTLRALDLCRTELPISDLKEDYIEVTEDAILLDVVAKMRAAEVSVALVKEKDTASVSGVKGLIPKRRIADIVVESSETFTS